MNINQLTAKQGAKLNSYESTEQYLDENAAIIAALPALQANVAQFKTINAAINAAAEQKSASLTGIALGKNTIRQILTEQAVAIAGLIASYADETGDEQLREEMNFPPSKIKRLRDENLAPFCQLIHDRANTHRGDLENYGITAAKLTGFQTTINDYAAENPKPRAAVSNRKTTNTTIANLFKANDALLENRLDKQIESLRKDHPEFVQTYFSNREIAIPISTPTQLKGIVTAAPDGKPVKTAAVTVTPIAPTDEDSPFTVATDASGAYTIKPIPAGSYTITATATGYQPFEQETVRLKLGAVNHFDIVLKK